MAQQCVDRADRLLRIILTLAVPLPARAVRRDARLRASLQPTTQPAQDIPDAPSTVQPPAPKPAFPDNIPPGANRHANQIGLRPAIRRSPADRGKVGASSRRPPWGAYPPARRGPETRSIPQDDLYKISVTTNFVQLPVMVKDSDGRRVDGLLPKDFSVTENGKTQTLTYFTSDPFRAFRGHPARHRHGRRRPAEGKSDLLRRWSGAFSPYDEVALYTYSSTVSQVTDFTGRSEKLTAVLNQMKLVRGHNNGPPVLGGPLPGGPTVNGAPVGGPTIQPVNTPPRESHVLNDAILRAALDLSKRDRTRRKVIFVISDGREFGSQASYSDVLKVLETRDIQVKAVVVDSGALPVFKQIGKIHLKGQGYSDHAPQVRIRHGGRASVSPNSRATRSKRRMPRSPPKRGISTPGICPQGYNRGLRLPRASKSWSPERA